MINCSICKKEVKETDRIVAYGEVDGYGWRPEEGFIDEVTPVEDVWTICHYSCFFKVK